LHSSCTFAEVFVAGMYLISSLCEAVVHQQCTAVMVLPVVVQTMSFSA
jgi:hypothetical protein